MTTSNGMGGESTISGDGDEDEEEGDGVYLHSFASR